MCLSSPAQELGAGSNRNSVQRNVPASPAPDPAVPSQNGITTSAAHGDYDSKLSEILAMPKMTGAVIAVAFGDHLECIRSLGQSAPPIGSWCKAGVGLTGACFATGKAQLCNDTENDSRAHRQACADLGVRSVLVVPIKRGAAVAGILEVLSSKPNAFDWRAIRRTKRIAREFDAFALESSVHPPRRHDGIEQTATRAVRGLANLLDLQEVLYSVWLIQQHGSSDITLPFADAGKLLEAQVDCGQGRGSSSRELAGSELPVEEHTAQGDADVPSFGTREDAAPSFGAVKQEFANAGRYLSLAALAIAFAILFACFLVFRAHQSSLSALLGFAPQVPKGSSRSSPAALHQDPHIAEKMAQAESQNGLLVRQSAPTQPLTNKPIPQSSAGAIAKFEEAARKGDADANWNLGLRYLKGVGVAKDEGTAAKWIKKAANLGDPRAQATLSDLYVKGVGVRRDYVRAYTWASIAAGQLVGQDERLVALRQRMTRAELEDANRRVETWFAHKDR